MTPIILTGCAGCLILIASHFLRTWQQQNLVRLILRQRSWVHPLDEELRRVGPLERVESVLASLERRGEVVRSIRGSYWRYRRG